MSTPSNPYNAIKHQVSKAAEDAYNTTLARLEKIQSQFVGAPQGTLLKGKVCIITGVGSLKGIGRASAINFAHEGAKHLYLIDYDPTNLPNLKSTIEKAYSNVKVTTISADASDESAISDVCNQAIREEGRLDVFFANAGVASKESLENTSAETFMRIMKVNALSCFLAVKHASAAMKKSDSSKGKDASGGSIILTASVAGLRSGAGTIDYSASKAAVNSIAMTCANQLANTDIRVNSVCPGLIETGMTGATFDYARQRGTANKIGQLNPMRRFGIPEEIARVAVFLASDNASYVNGQNIAIDGGLSSSHPVILGRWV